MSKKTLSSGTKWESIAGFSRAVRVNDHIYISGTTATDGDQLVGKNDIAKQTLFILERIEEAISNLGGKLTDVVRTRIYISNMKDWEIVSKIHGSYFNLIKPACTLVEAKLVGECLVEVEADAIIQS